MALTRFTSSTNTNRFANRRGLLSGYVGFSIFVLALTAGCGDRPATSVDALSQPQFRRVGNVGLEITFPAEVQLDWIRIFDRGDSICDFPAAGTRKRFFIPLTNQRRPGDQIEFVAAGGKPCRRFPLEANAPRQQLVATIEAPAGQDPVVFESPADSESAKTIALIVGPDRQVTLALNAENQSGSSGFFEWELKAPRGATVSFDTAKSDGAANWNFLDGIWVFHGRLPLAQQNWRETIYLKLPPAADREQMTIAFRQPAQRDAPGEQAVILNFLNAAPAELQQMVSAGDVRFPTDRRGLVQPERTADEVQLPNPVWSTLLGWLQPAARVQDRYAENAWQTLPLTNRTRFPLNLAIESFVTAEGSDEPLLNFAPPAWKAPKEAAVSEQLLRLAPGETAPAVLPVYVREETAAGDYRRHLRVRLVGNAEPLVTQSAPLLVVRGNPLASLVVIASLSCVALAWCLAPWLWTRILGNLSVENLTTIALLSGAHFLIAYTSRLAADAFAALAGPFAVFLAGIGNEGLTSALVAALLVLVPRVGVLTLSSLTVFLLQAMFTGQLGLVDLLMVTVSIVVQEGLLFLLGITRAAASNSAAGNSLSETVKHRLTPAYAMRIALAIGLGNALALYAQFCLATELYRLYFATWYVLAVAVVTGLIYGGLGAASGAALGFQLRRTAR